MPAVGALRIFAPSLLYGENMLDARQCLRWCLPRCVPPARRWCCSVVVNGSHVGRRVGCTRWDQIRMYKNSEMI
eukprot:306865-Pyramimonas_sp.AAC.1